MSLNPSRREDDYANENINPDPSQEVATMLRDAECLLHDLAGHAGIDLDGY